MDSLYEAIDNYKELLNLLNKEEDLDRMFKALINLSVCYYHLSDIESSMIANLKGIAMCDSLNNNMILPIVKTTFSFS